MATFPADAAPVVPADGKSYAFKGIIGLGALTLAVQSGAKDVLIGPEGVTTGGAFTNMAPVTLVGDQTWTTPGTVRFAPGAPISSRAQSSLTLVAGVHAVYLESANPDLAVWTTYGTLCVLAEDALGGTNTTVTAYGSGDQACSKDARLVPLRLYGFKQHATVKVTGINNSSGNHAFKLDVSATNVFTGCVTLDVPNHVYSFNSFGKGAELRFEGGYVHDGVNRECMTVFQKDNFNVVFGTSVNETKLVLNAAGTATIDCSGNTFRRGIHLIDADARLRLPVAHAFIRQDGTCDIKNMTRLSILSFTQNGQVDLCGTEQEVQILTGTSGRITSDTPSVFTLDGDMLWSVGSYYDSSPTVNTNGLSQCTNAVVFSGNVSLVKTGVLTNVFCGASTATGTVRVAAGRLVFAPGSAWTGATSVRVDEGGTLALDQSKVFAKDVDVYLASSSSLDLGEGIEQKCRYLYVDGVRQRFGLWGSADSAAAHKSSLFSGTGILNVRGEGGTLFLVR